MGSRELVFTANLKATVLYTYLQTSHKLFEVRRERIVVVRDADNPPQHLRGLGVDLHGMIV